MGAQITDDHLNAFVDGELKPHDAARVTLAITSDRAIAQRVARLQQMKSAVSGFADAASVPDIPLHKPDRRPVWRAAVGLAGMAVALVMLGLSIPSLNRTAPETAIAPGTIAPTFMAQHDQWTAQSQISADFDLPDDYVWMAPVMLSSNLRLVYLASSGAEVHLGFKGPNACRISLFVTAAEGGDGGLKMDIAEPIQHAQWQTGALGFMMIARDMAPTRFATVATGLHLNSRTHSPDPAMQVALLQAARLPCNA